jgi:hypothetical protein
LVNKIGPVVSEMLKVDISIFRNWVIIDGGQVCQS